MSFEMIYPRNLEGYLKGKVCQLIDVRTKEEYEQGHIKGARNFPYEEIEIWEQHMPGNRVLIFYCTHGGNSMQAARRLGQQGYHTATVIGGYNAMMKYLEKN